MPILPVRGPYGIVQFYLPSLSTGSAMRMRALS